MGSIYAADGVDFTKEHEVVDIMKALFERTKGNVADLESMGFKLPKEIGYFSDGVTLDLGKLVNSLPTATVLRLVMGTDGAGTKPLVHLLYRMLGGTIPMHLASVGIDTIAMVANDLGCGFARPFLLQDYIAWTNPDVSVAADLASGLKIGADAARAVVMGGENASLREMIKGVPPPGSDIEPGYAEGYDISATAFGLEFMSHNKEEPKLEEGDVIIGVLSSGIHCNGISSARRMVDYPAMGWTGPYKPDEPQSVFGGKTILEEILTPTLIYNNLIESLNKEVHLKGVVNITGEGVLNLERLLKGSGLGAELDFQHSGTQPHNIFEAIQDHRDYPDDEMYTAFNMGIGMYFVVPKHIADKAVQQINSTPNPLLDQNYEAVKLGELVKDETGTIKVQSYKGNEHHYVPEKKEEGGR